MGSGVSCGSDLDRQHGRGQGPELNGENDRARFIREANLLALLQHQHVVKYISCMA